MEFPLTITYTEIMFATLVCVGCSVCQLIHILTFKQRSDLQQLNHMVFSDETGNNTVKIICYIVWSCVTGVRNPMDVVYS